VTQPSHPAEPHACAAAARRSRALVAALALPVAAAMAGYAVLWSGDQWRPAGLAVVLLAAIAYACLRERELVVRRLSFSGSLIPFYAAVALLGPVPAGLALAASQLAISLWRRRSAGVVASNLLSDLLLAPAAAGVLAALGALLGTSSGDPLNLVALVAAGFVADCGSVVLLTGLARAETGAGPPGALRAHFRDIAGILAVGMVMTAGVVWVYEQGGLAALTVVLVALPVFYELLDRIDRIENELRVERDRNARYLAVARSILLVLDADGRIELINRRGAELLGSPESELVGRDWFALTAPPDEVDARRAEFRERLGGHGDEDQEGEAVLALRPGGERVVTWNTTVLFDEEGVASGMLVSSEDVTARRRAEARVSHLAYHDQLTGLANRAALEQRLDPALAAAGAAGGAAVLVFLDVDGFKAVNDEHGHAAGDELLRQIAGRLREVVRGDDLLVRQGGDEFLVLCRVPRERLEASVERVRERVESVFERPFELDGRRVASTGSIGVAVYPDEAADGEALVRRADDAMYVAKRRSARARVTSVEGRAAA
jgi:diguanylate cyclase (GGDEF)-like protein/PAS domain S-box-containing protein